MTIDSNREEDVTEEVPSDYQPLLGKAALVTGASRGIGAAIAKELARQGARVAITYVKSEAKAREVVHAITSQGGTAVAFQADSSTVDGARHGVQAAVAAFGSIDILVNNAGVGYTEPFMDAPPEHIDATFDLNVRGTLTASREAINHLPEGGRIIMIGSTGGQMSSFPGRSVYGATKAALKGFTQGSTSSRALGQHSGGVASHPMWPISWHGWQAIRPTS
jgi:3-oxoacyl-[acyl-carrier protein] reductase